MHRHHYSALLSVAELSFAGLHPSKTVLSPSFTMSRESVTVNPAAKRIEKDLAKFKADQAAQAMYHIEPENEDDIFQLKGYVFGPPDTPYQGGVFHLKMTVPNDYPFRPPVCKMTTKVWHPNIGNRYSPLSVHCQADHFSPPLFRRSRQHLSGHSEWQVDRRHVHSHGDDEHSGAAQHSQLRQWPERHGDLPDEQRPRGIPEDGHLLDVPLRGGQQDRADDGWQCSNGR